jgi:hypothetical protein
MTGYSSKRPAGLTTNSHFLLPVKKDAERKGVEKEEKKKALDWHLYRIL